MKKAVKSSIASKQTGLEGPLSDLVSDAVVQITSSTSNAQENKAGEDGSQRAFDIDSLRTCKIPGGSLRNSFVVDGMVVPRDCNSVEKSKTDCKVVVYGQGLEFQQTEAKGTVLLENADQLMDFTKVIKKNTY